MGNFLFNLMMSRPEACLERIAAKFVEVDARDVAVSDSPQLVSGTVSCNQELIAPLSGKRCVYYKVQAFELRDINDAWDWHSHFVEERALSFGVGEGIFIDASVPSAVNCMTEAVMELHTGEDAFPLLEFDEEPGEGEKVMELRAENEHDKPSRVFTQGVSEAVRDLAARNNLDLHVEEGKFKRLRFVEKIVELSDAKRTFIGVVSRLDAPTPLGQKLYKMEPVRLDSYNVSCFLFVCRLTLLA